MNLQCPDSEHNINHIKSHAIEISTFDLGFSENLN